MTTSAATLNRLVEVLPTLASRLTASRPGVEALRADQESLAAAIENASRGADPAIPAALANKWLPLAEKQQKYRPRLLELDMPGLEARQANAAVALRAATSDLREGLLYDVFASQAWAKRELERLRLAVDRVVPPDDRTQDLARRLAHTGDTVLALPEPTGRPTEPFIAALQESLKHLSPLVLPEAASLLHDARETLRIAELASREGASPDEIRRRTRDAVHAMSNLAARLDGRETDLDRVKRLAASRRLATDAGKKRLSKPFDPAASNEARNQLVREMEELSHTRVGIAAQVNRKKANELYSRLRAHNEPDRQVLLQRQLAETLEEIASQMADIAELALGRDAVFASPIPDPADAYLPSKTLAELLRALARDERALRDRLNGVHAEIARQTVPADNDPLAVVEAKQRGLVVELAEWEPALVVADRLRVGWTQGAMEAAEVVAKRLREYDTPAALEMAARQDAIRDEIHEWRHHFSAVAARQKDHHATLLKQTSSLARSVEVAASTAASGSPLLEAAERIREAEKVLREENLARAEAILVTVAARLKPTGEVGHSTPVAEAVLRAEIAMRQAMVSLGQKPDRSAAESAMRNAADILK